MLNHLIAINSQAEKGFQRAARYIDNPNQKQFFLQQANQRQDFKRDIQALVQTLGGEVETGNSITSDLHHGWMEMKASLFNPNDERLLKQVDRQEDAFLNEYTQFLNAAEEIPSLVIEVIKRQYSIASNTRLRVKEVEELLEDYA